LSTSMNAPKTASSKHADSSQLSNHHCSGDCSASMQLTTGNPLRMISIEGQVGKRVWNLSIPRPDDKVTYHTRDIRNVPTRNFHSVWLVGCRSQLSD
jgi:hypothetical protein